MTSVSRFTSLSEAAESLLGQLADEFIEANHRHEPQDIEAVAALHPELSDVIRRTFPAMLALRSPRPAIETPLASPHGEALGDFLLLQEIGRGGMGVVFEAIQRSLGRRVALKVLPLASTLNARNLRRFQNEARAAGILQHPNIVSVFGVGCERGVHYYAMQLIDGLSLAEILRGNDEGSPRNASAAPDASTAAYAELSTRNARPSERYRAVARLGAQAADALEYAHREGVIHRDIKPSNLLLDRHGTLWIADFGLARIQSGGELTDTGDLLGTLRYMSPEQFADNKVVDQRTDIYSLGLTLYELLALKPAYDHAPRESLKKKILGEDVTPLRELDASIPIDLETIVLKSISKEPADRYATAGELARDLSRFLEDRPIQARRLSIAEQAARWARRHAVIFLSVAAMTLLALVLVSAAWRAESARRQQAVQTARDLDHQLYYLKVAMAQEAIEHDRVAEAVVQLNSCPEALRNWEWRYLLRQTNQSRKTLHPHDHRVSFVQFSPDGRLFLTAGHDGKLTVWNARSERLSWSWRSAHVEPDWGLFCAAFSSDSKTIAVGDQGGVATLFDAETGAPRYEVQTGDAVRSVAFSPDGSAFVTGGANGILALYRTSDGERLWRDVNPLAQQIYSVEFHPDGREIATSATPEAPVKIWDVASGKLLRQFTDPHPKQLYGDVCCVRYSRDGAFLVSAADDRTLKLWDAVTGELLRTEIGHSNWVRWLEFSPDGQWIATACRDSTIGIWQASNLELQTKLRGHLEYVYCLGWSPDGESLISCSSGKDNSVMLWDAAQWPGERRLAGDASLVRVYPREDSVNALAISRAPRILCAGHQGGAITVWDLDSGLELADLLATDEVELSALAITPDATRLVAGKANGKIDVWDLQWNGTGEPIDPRLVHSASADIRTKVQDIDLSAKFGLCLAAISDGSVIALDATHWQRRFKIAAHAGACRAVAVIPATDLFATCGDDGAIRLWDVANGEMRGVLANEMSGVRSLAVSHDGQLLVSGDDAGLVKVWDMASRAATRSMQANSGSIRTLAFHPTEHRFASSCEEGAIRLWGCEVFQPVLNLRPRPELRLRGRDVFSTAFSADGRYFAAGMEDGSIRVWDSQGVDETLARRRRNVSKAAQQVDSLKLQMNRYADVVARLNAEQNATPADARLPLKIAIARRQLDPVVIRNAARSPELLRILSGENPTADELRQALQACESAQKDVPQDVWIMLLSASAHFRLEELDEALVLLRRADSLSREQRQSSNPAVLALRACVLVKQGDFTTASHDLERALELAEWPMWKDSREIATINAFIQTAQQLVVPGAR